MKRTGKKKIILINKAYLVAVFILTMISALTVNAAGEVDPTFNAAAYVNQNFGARVVVAQPDGKLLVAGDFTQVDAFARHGLVRLNANGNVDTSFDPPEFFEIISGLLGRGINTIALQSNGKILLGGPFGILGSSYQHVVRLNADGSIDNSLNNISSNFQYFNPIKKIVVQPDDGFFVASNGVQKFDANGNPVPGFNYIGTGGNVQDIAALPDGRFYVCDLGIARYNVDGNSLDGTFQIQNTTGGITEILIQPDGKVLIAGNFSNVGGFLYGRVARLNFDGTIDFAFNNNGIGANSIVFDVALATDGKIFIGGVFSQYNGIARPFVAKLNSDGTLDTSFTYLPPLVTANVFDVTVMPNGKIAVAGNSLGTITTNPRSIVILNSDGSNDVGFLVRTGLVSRIRETAVQTDGKILVVGEFPMVNGVARNALARLNADGSLDTGFVPYFNGLPGQQIIHAVVVQPDGKILVGATQGILMRRMNADGSQDSTFVPPVTNASTVFDIALQPDGKILIAGNFAFPGDSGLIRRLARLNNDGTIDSSFNAVQPDLSAYKVMLQPDGNILICGEFGQIGATVRGRIARYDIAGLLDFTFNPPGGANGGVYDMDLQPDGKIVLVGAFNSLNGNNAHRFIGRLNSNGSLDTGFVQAADSNVNSVKVQPDGKVLIGGVFSQIGGTPRTRLARLNSNGSLDLSFNASATATVLDINLQSDGKILLTGDFTEISNISRLTIARLLNAPAPVENLFDYDGDGKADVSVFRPSTNRWYVFKSSDATVFEATFGLSGDVVAPADYDGDNKTDLGIFRPSSGDWWYQSSINNAQIPVHWGASGDIPRPSDFDGDGKADFIVFRPSNSVWYRFGSTGATSITAFGLSGDKPVVADFDGDGKSDLAIFRPSTGDWWWQASTDNSQRATHWGISTDIPAPADFDGDGRTDFAVYRPSTGVWYVINSGNGSFTIFQFGIAEDKPVPADYDGDGKADIAVFRPSTGVWYQQKTTAGFAAQQFGVGTDFPTENAFVP